MVNKGRRCARCGAWLASDNRAARCSACQTAGGAHPAEPPAVPAGFWLDPELQAALDSRHMGRVIRAYRQHVYHGHRGLTQDLVAGWGGITQGQLSTIETGSPINNLGRLISWALLLGIPSNTCGSSSPAIDSDSRSARSKRSTTRTSSFHRPVDRCTSLRSRPSGPLRSASISGIFSTPWRPPR